MIGEALVASVSIIGGLVVWFFVAQRTMSLERREKISGSIMGINTKRIKPRSHGVLDTSKFASVDDYYRMLKRDDRATFNKIPMVFERNGITVKSATYKDISSEHFKVILSHEARVYWFLRAFIITIMRYPSTSIMVGTLDNFYIDGKLVAFSHTIIKGNTLRAMWFYQREEVSRCSIWFYAIQKAISRAIATEGVHFVDLGPSINAKVKEAKQKLLFADTQNWQEVCDYYSGPFKDPCL